jgi:pimeloyl-ACP methyl ester carboxylesterase
MRDTVRVFLMSCVALLATHAWAQPAPPAASSLGAAAITCAAGQPTLNQQGFLTLGGIEQWVTIKGDNCANPVLLMVHGGPGNPLSPYANLPYAAWEKDFTVVMWDQRGAGRTYGRNPVDPESAEGILTIAQMAADGNELAAWAAGHLRQKKVILFGGSWSSALGVTMAKTRPELFFAYVGTGQLVRQPDNNAASYRHMMTLAHAAGDSTTLAALEAMGPPPWDNPRAPGQLRRLSRPYEAKTSTPAPDAWWTWSADYDNKERHAEYTNGEDFSWLQYVGYKNNGMGSTLDLPKLGLDFRIPVFMLQGTEDLVTLPEVSRRYFDSISAPQKEYFLLPHVGHDPNPPMIEAQYNVLTTRVLPLLK